MFHVSNFDSLKTVYLAHFHSVMKCQLIWDVIHLRVNGHWLHKSKLLELWLVQNLDIEVKSV